MRTPLALLAAFAFAPWLHAATPAAPAADEVATRFRRMDADGDGFVTVGEQLAHLLASADTPVKLTAEQSAAAEQIAKAFVADSDADHDGRLSLAEWRAPAKSELERMFRSADTNADGYATLDEMRRSIRTAKFGEKSPDAEQLKAIDAQAAQSLTLFDFDGDGRISFIELKKFLELEASAPAKPTLDAAAVDQILDTKPAFAAVDADKNNRLTQAEIMAWARVRLRQAGPAHQAAFQQKGLVLAGYDTDGDGRVSRAEWDAGLNARAPETQEQRVDRLVAAFGALSFADLDADHNGVVTEGEVAAATDKLAAGAPAQDALMLRMIAGMNLSKRQGEDGKITRASWDAATRRYEAERMKERIAERFTAMDKNADGAIVAAELVAYMVAQQDDAPGAEKMKELADGAAQYVGVTDRDADNKISLAEYTEAVLEAQRAAEREAKAAETDAKLDAILAAHPLSAEDRASFTGKFKAMDATGDGTVTLAEMTLFIKTTATAANAGKALTAAQNEHAERQCAAFMGQLDVDGDRAASLKEYLAGLAASSGQ